MCSIPPAEVFFCAWVDEAFPAPKLALVDVYCGNGQSVRDAGTKPKIINFSVCALLYFFIGSNQSCNNSLH